MRMYYFAAAALAGILLTGSFKPASADLIYSSVSDITDYGAVTHILPQGGTGGVINSFSLGQDATITSAQFLVAIPDYQPLGAGSSFATDFTVTQGSSTVFSGSLSTTVLAIGGTFFQGLFSYFIGLVETDPLLGFSLTAGNYSAEFHTSFFLPLAAFDTGLGTANLYGIGFAQLVSPAAPFALYGAFNEPPPPQGAPAPGSFVLLIFGLAAFSVAKMRRAI